MKNIIVPTDFSAHSIEALDYAIQVANQFGSQIHLVTGIDTNAATGIYTDVGNMMKDAAKVKLIDAINSESGLLKANASIIGETLRGNTINAVCEYAEDHYADLIVMGTQGASGLKEVFIGSIAQGVINESNIPVLVIPKDTPINAPKRIAITIDDHTLKSKKVVDPVKALTKAFQTKLEVFHFNKDFADDSAESNVEDYLGDIRYTFHEHYSNEKDVVKAIDEFVKEESIDILAMVRRKRNFWERLFHKSLTTKEVFHSTVPVLVLYD